MTQPQSMVERVARAICGKNCDMPKCSCQPSTESRAACRWLSMDQARVAIEAMREPSEAMIATADDAYDQCTDTGDFYGFIWRAMIDVALAEQSPAQANPENGIVRGEG